MTQTSGPPAPEPKRQLVVCCDGTSNTLTGGRRDTNVVRLVDMLQAGGARKDPDQLVYYDPGVGSPDGLPPTGLMGYVTEPLRKMLGLAVGSGIYDNIGQAYLFLCREYGKYETLDSSRTDDEIYLFGFSRGAFTVRAVAGMVHMFGLIRPDQEQLLPTLLNVYFTPQAAREQVAVKALRQVRGAMVGGPPKLSRGDIADQVRTNFTTRIGAEAQVHFIGVWDTVKSVGVPGLRKEITNDATIHGLRFTHVRHLLSLDEHRRQFLARPFTGTVREGEQSLRQYWVRGVHGDVGGGGNRFEVQDDEPLDSQPSQAGQPADEPKAGAQQHAKTRVWTVSALSELTFRWMVAEAQEVGLRNVALAGEEQPGVKVIVDRNVPITDQLHTVPWWTLTGMALRKTDGVPAGNVLKGGSEARLEEIDPRSVWFDGEPSDHRSVDRLSTGIPADLLLRRLGAGEDARDLDVAATPAADETGSNDEPADVRSVEVEDRWVKLEGVSVRSPWSALDLRRRWRSLGWAVIAVFAAAQLVRVTGEWPVTRPTFVDDPTGIDLLTRTAMLVASVFVAGVLSTRAYSLRLIGRRANDPRPRLELRGTKDPRVVPKDAPRLVRWGAAILRLEPGVLTISPLGNVVSFVLVGGLGSIVAHALALAIGWDLAAGALKAIAGVFDVVAWAGVFGVGFLLVLAPAGLLASLLRAGQETKWRSVLALGIELVAIAGVSAAAFVLVGSGDWLVDLASWAGDRFWVGAGIVAAVVLLVAAWSIASYRRSVARPPG